MKCIERSQFVFLYGIFFITDDEPGEEMMRIFSELCQVLYPRDLGSACIVLSHSPINQSSVFGYIVLMFNVHGS